MASLNAEIAADARRLGATVPAANPQALLRQIWSDAEGLERRTLTVFALDTVGFSDLLARGEGLAVTNLRGIRRRLIAPILTRHGAQAIKGLGDGLLAAFDSSVSAVSCALELQGAVEACAAVQPQALQIHFRLALHAGGVICGDNINGALDIYGTAVATAWRLQALGRPGAVLLSDSVARDIRADERFLLTALGGHAVRNHAEPLLLYQVSRRRVAK